MTWKTGDADEFLEDIMNGYPCKCRVCEGEFPLEMFAKDKRQSSGHRNICKKCARYYQRCWYLKNRTRLRDAEKERRKDYKRRIVDHYGGKCACCGEDRIEFMSVDHIEGGGNEHRRKVAGGRGGTGFYQWIIRNNYPEGLQILCENCNQSKGRYGYCPHEKNEVARNRRATERLSAGRARGGTQFLSRIKNTPSNDFANALRAYANILEGKDET